MSLIRLSWQCEKAIKEHMCNIWSEFIFKMLPEERTLSIEFEETTVLMLSHGSWSLDINRLTR